MNKPTKQKVMDILVEDRNYICILDRAEKHGNVYRLYERWYDNGWHRKQLIAYANFISVIEHIRQIAFNDHWGFQDCCF